MVSLIPRAAVLGPQNAASSLEEVKQVTSPGLVITYGQPIALEQ